MFLSNKLPLIIAGLMLSTPLFANADIEQTYNESCAICHDAGVFNAPKAGDTTLWKKLKAQKGMPALVASVKNGMPQMPAGGMCNDCDDSDYRELIEYMSK